MSIRQWKAAVCQSEPCWFDKDAAIEKSIKLITEAKANCAALIAFSEVWIPGYPNFLWSGNFKENIPLVHKYMQNSITAYGDEMLQIRRCAAQHGIYVAFGFSERVGSSLYLAQVLIGPDGNILLHRRKTKPTHVERTLFGDSTGDSLTTVADTPLGKIGMLNCWGECIQFFSSCQACLANMEHRTLAASPQVPHLRTGRAGPHRSMAVQR
ncbi:hypothetical protein V2G26_003933 [Clonostachys chloroleuca]